jgi:hypothetical protein
MATAAGTLVLAVATFSATRSANRASRIAERSLLATLRPVLVHAQLGDPRQKIGFADQHWVHVDGPEAVFQFTNGVVYLAFGLRNVGSGIAILRAWYPTPGRELSSGQQHRPVEEFRPLTRALYVPPGGLGFWQGALRDPSEQVYADFVQAASDSQPVTIDVLYADMNGGQRTVTRMSVLPVPQDDSAASGGQRSGATGSAPPAQRGRWVASIGLHWLLDESDRR